MGPELICLSAMRNARVNFFAGVEAHAAKISGANDVTLLEREHRKTLRSDAVAQIAEFFYVLSHGGLKIPDDLHGFLSRHNADMEALETSCRNGYTVGGLSIQRIRRARFSPAQINYVMHESANGQPRFDQQSLQRVFSQIMSFETCRSVLVILSEFGFLQRWEFNQVVIGSTGVLEELYRSHLEEIVNAIKET